MTSNARQFLLLLICATFPLGVYGYDLAASCRAGDAGSCNDLGVRYDEGQGVRKDKFKAVELYEIACKMGSAGGCYNLATMYQNGEGVRFDEGAALEFFGKACDLKFAAGCEKFAELKRARKR